jgi:hypothetical protein
MARRFLILGLSTIYAVFILVNWDIFYWCPEINTSSTTPFYWFTLVLHASLLKGLRSHTLSNK